jgi:CysZ protein
MSRTHDIATGFLYIFKGSRFLCKNRKLWAFAVLPTLIDMLILIAMFSVFAHFYSDFYGWLSSHLGGLGITNPDRWYLYLLSGILWIIDVFFQIIIWIVSLILMLIAAYAISFIVAAPFNDMLSERVEIILTGKLPIPFSFKKFVSDVIRTVKIESLKAAILIFIPIFLFILNLIPAVGALAYVLLTIFFGAWDMGFSFADLPLGRRVMPIGKRWEFAKREKWALIGLGAGFIIPFFALIFMAPMVVAGTMFYVNRTAASTLPRHS